MIWIKGSKRIAPYDHCEEAVMAENTDTQSARNADQSKKRWAEIEAALEQLEKSVRERPLLGVGLAAAAGFLLGTLWRR